MAKLNEEFFKELEESIEQTLESWMQNHLKVPMEGTITRHLTDFNKTMMGMEERHKLRWKWVMGAFTTLIITNIALIVVALWQ